MGKHGIGSPTEIRFYFIIYSISKHFDKSISCFWMSVSTWLEVHILSLFITWMYFASFSFFHFFFSYRSLECLSLCSREKNGMISLWTTMFCIHALRKIAIYSVAMRIKDLIKRSSYVHLCAWAWKYGCTNVSLSRVRCYKLHNTNVSISRVQCYKLCNPTHTPVMLHWHTALSIYKKINLFTWY